VLLPLYSRLLTLQFLVTGGRQFAWSQTLTTHFGGRQLRWQTIDVYKGCTVQNIAQRMRPPRDKPGIPQDWVTSVCDGIFRWFPPEGVMSAMWRVVYVLSGYGKLSVYSSV
jgi:hypothetical protein